MLSDEQMRKIWPFSLLNDEQMSNKVGVKHLPDIIRLGGGFTYFFIFTPKFGEMIQFDEHIFQRG